MLLTCKEILGFNQLIRAVLFVRLYDPPPRPTRERGRPALPFVRGGRMKEYFINFRLPAEETGLSTLYFLLSTSL